MSLNINQLTNELTNLGNTIECKSEAIELKKIETVNSEDNNTENKSEDNIVIDNDCGICGAELISDVVKLKCNHMYHFECISLSYKFSHTKQCPYCRQFGGNLPNKNKLKPIGSCEGILKSGKRKGEKCGCSLFKNPLSLKLCKRHYNIEQKKNI